MLEYQLIRSKRRKTLLLQVRHGKVIVRAPQSVGTQVIDDFVQNKSAWLRTKITEQQGEIQHCDYTHGSTLLLLGKPVKLNIYAGQRTEVLIAKPNTLDEEAVNQASSEYYQLHVVIRQSQFEKLLCPIAKAKQVKKQLEKYFKEQAEKIFVQRVEVLSKQTSLVPTKLSIRQYRARWGSCNNRGEVNLNYLLMMTPMSVIDYVIVHELCHLEHLDHSKAFWQLVKSYCPNFEAAKNWLRHHQAQLYWQPSH